MQSYKSEYFINFLAESKAKRKKSKISFAIELIAIIALCAGMGYWFAIAI